MWKAIFAGLPAGSTWISFNNTWVGNTSDRISCASFYYLIGVYYSLGRKCIIVLYVIAFCIIVIVIVFIGALCAILAESYSTRTNCLFWWAINWFCLKRVAPSASECKFGSKIPRCHKTLGRKRVQFINWNQAENQLCFATIAKSLASVRRSNSTKVHM